MTDFYAVLGIGRTAEPEAIAKAYRRSALTYNPECNSSHDDQVELARRFKLVSTAYYVLSDAKLRAIYDVYGEDGVRHGGTGKVGVPGGVALDEVKPDVVFRQFFGVDSPFQVLGDITGSRGNQHQFYSEIAAVDKNPPKAPAEQVEIQVTLEEVFEGALKKISWTNKNCTSSGDVISTTPKSWEISIPKGIADKTVLVLAGLGGTKEGCSTADVHVTVNVAPHPYYIRDGDNLRVIVPITLVDALTGVTVKVQTIDRREVSVLIDEVVHPKFKRAIQNEGMHVFGEPTKRGDLIVECNTTFPAYLTAEQKSEIRRILSC
jgi:DnaJ family protein B protein 4